jgi:hypothetical protein
VNRKKILFLFWLIFTVSGIGFAQDSDSPNEIKRQKRNLVADSGYALLNINTSNIILNLGARLGDAGFAQTNYKTIGESLFASKWMWEDGDRFLINQFGHPYQGSTYFTSARANGFNFYESILFGPIGSFLWETTCEPEPSINDLITTSIAGVALGEMLHRLFLETAASPSFAAKIAGFFLSPIDSFNHIYNRPSRETGGGNIYELSLKTGVEKTAAFFPGHQNEADSWKYPGAHLEANVVYGNPFEQPRHSSGGHSNGGHSNGGKTPYQHFELNAGITTNISSYDMEIISDGYIFSFFFEQEAAFTSTGLTMHYDFFNATNDIIDNTGYGNIQFSSSALAWTIKHKRELSKEYYMEVKAHLGYTFWGNSMYNSAIFNGTYLGNTSSTYGVGESLKLFFTASHQKKGRLEFAALGYHLVSLAVNEAHSEGDVFFVNGSVSYDFPISARIGIGLKQNFSGLFGMYDSAENVNRLITSTGIFLRFNKSLTIL